MLNEDKAIAVIDSYIAEGSGAGSTIRDTIALTFNCILSGIAVFSAIFIYAISESSYVEQGNILILGAATFSFFFVLLIFIYIQNYAINYAVISYINKLSILKRKILKGDYSVNVDIVDSHCSQVREKYAFVLKKAVTLRGTFEFIWITVTKYQ